MMDFVTEHVAIGSRRDAQDLETLQRRNISAVLNVAWDLDIRYDRAGAGHLYPIEYHKVGMIDGEGNRPTTLLAAVFMLAQLRERHPRVLVHCHAGVSRSSTVVCLYLMREEGLSFDGALARIRQARSIANPHPALIRLATELARSPAWATALAGDTR